MAKRRAHGEGSVFQRKSDGRWYVVIDLGRRADGKRSRRTYSAGSQREAIELLKKLQVEQATTGIREPSRMTVAEFLEKWISEAVHGNVKPSTEAIYANAVRSHIVPLLGGTRLDRLRPMAVQEFVSALKTGRGRRYGKPLSPRTQQIAFDVLARAMQQAVRWELIAANPAAAARRPRAESPEIEVFSPDEVQRILEVAAEDRLGALFILALTTGMRQGEIFALTWDEIDWDRAVAQVRASLSRHNDTLVRSSLKTKKSRRNVPLPKRAVEALRRHRKAMLAEGLHNVPGNFVFVNLRGKPMSKSNFRARHHKRLLAAAGVRYRNFHVFRHTAASMLLAEGVDLGTVSRMLGHSTPNLTLSLYGHMVPGKERVTAERMDDILGAST